MNPMERAFLRGNKLNPIFTVATVVMEANKNNLVFFGPLGFANLFNIQGAGEVSCNAF